MAQQESNTEVSEVRQSVAEVALEPPARPRRSTDARAKNGLQVLAELGVPESAITALLLALVTLTCMPYLAGRELGAYTIPQVLPLSTFWPLAVSLPLAWSALLVRTFAPATVDVRGLAKATGFLETIALPLAFLSAPIVEVKEFSATLQKGQPSPDFRVELPFTQRLEVSVTRLDGLPRESGVWITACRGSDTCVKDQRGVGNSPVAGVFPKGTVSISIFNFDSNPPTTASVRVTYTRRRYL